MSSNISPTMQPNDHVYGMSTIKIMIEVWKFNISVTENDKESIAAGETDKLYWCLFTS